MREKVFLLHTALTDEDDDHGPGFFKLEEIYSFAAFINQISRRHRHSEGERLNGMMGLSLNAGAFCIIRLA